MSESYFTEERADFRDAALAANVPIEMIEGIWKMSGQNLASAMGILERSTQTPGKPIAVAVAEADPDAPPVGSNSASARRYWNRVEQGLPGRDPRTIDEQVDADRRAAGNAKRPAGRL